MNFKDNRYITGIIKKKHYSHYLEEWKDDSEFIKYQFPFTYTDKTLKEFELNNESHSLVKHSFTFNIDISNYPQRLLDMFVKDGILIHLPEYRDKIISKILTDK